MESTSIFTYGVLYSYTNGNQRVASSGTLKNKSFLPTSLRLRTCLLKHIDVSRHNYLPPSHRSPNQLAKVHQLSVSQQLQTAEILSSNNAVFSCAHERTGTEWVWRDSDFDPARGLHPSGAGLGFRLVSELEEDTGERARGAGGPTGTAQVVQEAPARRRQTSRTASPAPPRAAGPATALRLPAGNPVPRASRAPELDRPGPPRSRRPAFPAVPGPRLGSGPWGARAGGRAAGAGAQRDTGKGRWGPAPASLRRVCRALGAPPSEGASAQPGRAGRGSEGRERVGLVGSSAFNLIRGRGHRQQGDAHWESHTGRPGVRWLFQPGGVHLVAGGALKTIQRQTWATPRA